MEFKKGFTLLEMAVSCAVIGILSILAISNVWANIPKHEAKENIQTVQQALIRGRSAAIRESQMIFVDFSQTTSNHGDEGGLIEIKKTDGTVLYSFLLSKNNFINSSGTTIQNSSVKFNYLGEPVDNTGSTSGFTTSNNTVSIGAFYNGSAKAVKSLSITPMTGTVTLN